MHAGRGEIADAISTHHCNPGRFPDPELTALTATTDPATVLGGAGFVMLSIPAHRPCGPTSPHGRHTSDPTPAALSM
ncbi:hypothetical protein ACGF5O_45110 [Streptomyces sp. NPDC048291]|uniref:hypothetical protein n=1 Tax=Streptomyces sp. NPDC048291 TaxID=3365530 RepID=UPI0037244245